jgi:hypothetical protein
VIVVQPHGGWYRQRPQRAVDANVHPQAGGVARQRRNAPPPTRRSEQSFEISSRSPANGRYHHVKLGTRHSGVLQLNARCIAF